MPRVQPPLKEWQGPNLDDDNPWVNNGGYMNPHCFDGALNPRVMLTPYSSTPVYFSGLIPETPPPPPPTNKLEFINAGWTSEGNQVSYLYMTSLLVPKMQGMRHGMTLPTGHFLCSGTRKASFSTWLSNPLHMAVDQKVRYM